MTDYSTVFCPYFEHCTKGTVCEYALNAAVKKAGRKYAAERGLVEAPIKFHVAIPECFVANNKGK
jgi:hypothetical protein